MAISQLRLPQLPYAIKELCNSNKNCNLHIHSCAEVQIHWCCIRYPILLAKDKK